MISANRPQMHPLFSVGIAEFTIEIEIAIFIESWEESMPRS
jgi:hypothetical protein